MWIIREVRISEGQIIRAILYYLGIIFNQRVCKVLRTMNFALISKISKVSCLKSCHSVYKLSFSAVTCQT